MRPMVKLAVALAVVVALLAGGGWLLLARRDSPPVSRLRPGSGTGGTGPPDGERIKLGPSAELRGVGRPAAARPLRHRAAAPTLSGRRPAQISRRESSRSRSRSTRCITSLEITPWLRSRTMVRRWASSSSRTSRW
jgi:hypothetical protein